MNKQDVYLGDGVYARWTDWGDLVLATSDGLSETNTIVLEPEVLRNLLRYLEARKAATLVLKERGQP